MGFVGFECIKLWEGIGRCLRWLVGDVYRERLGEILLPFRRELFSFPYSIVPVDNCFSTWLLGVMNPLAVRLLSSPLCVDNPRALTPQTYMLGVAY